MKTWGKFLDRWEQVETVAEALGLLYYAPEIIKSSIRTMTIQDSATYMIAVSRSKPGCPWENGYQESFYGKFKTDLGDPNRFKTLGELVAELYLTIHQYNTARIHSSLRMAPKQFAKLHTTIRLSTTVEIGV